VSEQIEVSCGLSGLPPQNRFGAFCLICLKGVGIDEPEHWHGVNDEWEEFRFGTTPRERLRDRLRAEAPKHGGQVIVVDVGGDHWVPVQDNVMVALGGWCG